MADNVPFQSTTLATPAAGETIAADDVGGVKYQVVKLDVGANGASDPVVGALPVTGPLTDAELRAAPVDVDGPLTDAELRASAVPVSAAALPLPSGAATEATLATRLSESDFDTKIGALTETAPATDTASSGLNGRLQRIAQRLTSLIALLPASLGQKAMAASLPVVVASDQSAVPVSGTVAVTGTVTANAGTNLNTSALALEAGGNLAAAAASLAVMDDWDETDRAKVNPIAGQAGVQGASGTVSANTQRVVLATDVGLPAGTNNIGDVDVLSVPRSQSGPGQPGTAVDSYTHAAINLAAGADQVLVASAPNKQIWVYGIGFVVNAAGTVSFQDEDNTAITGVMPFAANSGMAIPPSGNFSMPIWKLATDKDLEVDVVTAELDGWIDYAILSV